MLFRSIRQIREWQADLVMTPRAHDYHPDHRYTAMAVQDAAYLVVVPNIARGTAALRKNPVFMYFQDPFQSPEPFRPDVAVAIDDVVDRKIAMLDAHVSQFYEWLPWVEGEAGTVPTEPSARMAWLKTRRAEAPTPAIRAALVARYGNTRGNAIDYAEAFQLCEYGARADEDALRRLFPF